jgi:hypothetical protein
MIGKHRRTVKVTPTQRQTVIERERKIKQVLGEIQLEKSIHTHTTQCVFLE